MKKLLLFCFLFLSLISLSYSYQNISSCQTISSPGEYRINQSITNLTTSRCIWPQSNDVHIDCQGNSVQTGAYNDVFFLVYSGHALSNITINNCIINTGNIKIGNAANYVINSSFENNIFTGNYSHLYLEGANTRNNIFKNITFTNNSFGLIFEEGRDNFFDGMYLDGSYLAIFEGANNNTFTNSYFDLRNEIYANVFYGTSNSNYFYNNIFTNSSKITSENWALTPNYFNFSGIGNTYLDLENSSKICFDPLNTTCDFFALAPTVQGTPSLFPFSSIIPTLLIMIGFFFVF
jgi:hypothetical protein